jgi:hypothetical protein
LRSRHVSDRDPAAYLPSLHCVGSARGRSRVGQRGAAVAQCFPQQTQNFVVDKDVAQLRPRTVRRARRRGVAVGELRQLGVPRRLTCIFSERPLSCDCETGAYSPRLLRGLHDASAAAVRCKRCTGIPPVGSSSTQPPARFLLQCLLRLGVLRASILCQLCGFARHHLLVTGARHGTQAHARPL